MQPQNELIEELKKIPWFGELNPEHLQKIAAISFLRPVKAGEILFKEGAKQDYMYVVLEGRIALDLYVPHHGKVIFYTTDKWEVFGWSGVTPVVRQRTAGAMAVMDGLVVAIDALQLNDLCDQDHDLGYLFMRRMVNIVASRLMVTRLQLLDMFATPTEIKNDD